MKRILLAILFVGIMAVNGNAATCTFQSGGVDLNWSTVGNWDCGRVPIADDVVVIPTGLIAAMDVVRIPATSGSLASLTGTGTGQITVDLSNAICHPTAPAGCEIVVTGDIQAGTKPTAEGFILVSGTAASDHILTITAANAIGGTNTNASCIKVAATGGTVSLVGHAKGGSSTSAYGIVGTAATGAIIVSNGCEGGTGTLAYGCYVSGGATTLSITGDVKGGSGQASGGAYNVGSGATTLTSSNIINHATGGVGLAGRVPVWAPGTTGYIQWGITGTTDMKWYYDVPAAANVLTSDSVAGVTGTYHAPEASEVWYGAEVGTTTGTKRASSIANCEAGNVKDGVVIDDVTGTYAGEGGGGCGGGAWGF